MFHKELLSISNKFQKLKKKKPGGLDLALDRRIKVIP